MAWVGVREPKGGLKIHTKEQRKTEEQSETEDKHRDRGTERQRNRDRHRRTERGRGTGRQGNRDTEEHRDRRNKETEIYEGTGEGAIRGGHSGTGRATARV